MSGSHGGPNADDKMTDVLRKGGILAAKDTTNGAKGIATRGSWPYYEEQIATRSKWHRYGAKGIATRSSWPYY